MGWTGTALIVLGALGPPANAQFQTRMQMPASMGRVMQVAPSRGTATPMAFPQVLNPMPMGVPNVAMQAINPNFRIAPNLTVPQAAFNIATIGNALQQVPPYAFGYSPYMSGYGSGYGAMMSPYMMGSYGQGGSMMYGGGYGNSMMSSGGYGSSMMTDPYANVQSHDSHSNAGTQSGSYPTVSSSTNAVGDARLVLPAVTSSLVSNPTAEDPATTREVWIYDNSFSPPTTMVKAGTTIRWVNYGYHNHSVTSAAGLWDSGPIRRGAEFKINLKEPGTYQYVCRYHQRQMVATITVTK
jgi:plastocyanin